MAYRKPGVEITQEQRSATPILFSPDLESCIVGHGYHWQDINWDSETDPNKNSIHSVKYTGAELIINSSDINSEFTSIIPDTVIVDLVGITGDNAGQVTHLDPATDFTVALDVITIAADLAGLTALGDDGTALVKIGYLARNTGINGQLKKLNSLNDIRDIIGEPVSWNPLAFGAALAMENSGANTFVFGLSNEVGSEVTHTDAQQALSLEEVYAISVLDDVPSTTSYSTHVTNLSKPESRKERIVFVNDRFTYTGDNDVDSSSIRDRNSTFGNRRLFSTHPYAAYVMESRHVSTLKQAFLDASFSGSEATTHRPRFVSDITIGGVKYKANSIITDAIVDRIIENEVAGVSGLFTVFAPVPGYYYTAQIAGQVAGKPFDSPLTNVPTSGLNKTIGSQDKFSDQQLDVMGSGGTYIMTQNSEQSPIVSRHQMSTDITSVAKRELSITTALDATAKFFRTSLSPYIGRFNITDSFLKLLNSILISGALFLTRTGVVEDIEGISVARDTVSPDTVLVEMNVKVKFPVNYIKITLIF